jgi:hypothetical protein
MHAYTRAEGQCTIVLMFDFDNFEAFLGRLLEPIIVFLVSHLFIQLDNHALSMDLAGLFTSNMGIQIPTTLSSCLCRMVCRRLDPKNSKTTEPIVGLMIAVVLITAVLKFMQVLYT